jgi:ketosteroid isomerase-like protein
MRQMFVATIMLSLLCGVSHANDVADVSDAVNALYRSLGSKDLKTLATFIPRNGFTEFNPEHHDLQTIKLGYFEGAFNSGVGINLHIERMQARVNGATAIVTGYRVGSITFPDGKVVNDRSCLTMNWTKAKTWTLQHVHLSQCPV